jgi:hypothetical protein
MHIRIRSVYAMAVPREGIAEIGHDPGSLPVPSPCLRTSLRNKGPGRDKRMRRLSKVSRGLGRLGCVRLACTPAKRPMFKIATRRLNLVFLPCTFRCSSAERAETAHRDSVFLGPASRPLLSSLWCRSSFERARPGHPPGEWVACRKFSTIERALAPEGRLVKIPTLTKGC